MGVDNALILENLKKLSADGAKINIRIPTIEGVNATEEFMNQVIEFLQENQISVKRVNLLPYHNTGNHKYGKLDRAYDEEHVLGVPDKGRMELFKKYVHETWFQQIQKIGG